MTELRVWAPRARRVDLVIGQARVAMTPADGGWHASSDARLSPGIEYAFSLDGGPATPDPRSRSQPSGPHGASCLVDPGAFAWTDDGFCAPPLGAGAIYELHVGTFTAQGTLDGAIARLDHLVTLGVSHVELMPVADFPGERGWGYDGVGLYAVHRAYGGPAALARFVDACHARGLAVILDVVYNHLGPDGNYLSRFGPYFTDRYHTPWGEALNFDDAGSDEVRRFVVDNALCWLTDYHVDGLRLDAVHAISDRSATHVLEQLAHEVRALEGRTGRRLVLVAESDLNDPRLLHAPEVGGYGLDAQWSDDLHHAVHAWLTGERGGYYADFGKPEQVADALEHVFVLRGGPSEFRGRRHGRSPAGLGASRFVCYLQSHDQVGNRARGDRFAQQAGPARQRVAATLVLTSPFVPMILQGEEWAASAPFAYFTDHQDPRLARAVSEGRRREHAARGHDAVDMPDPQAQATFDSSCLAWDEIAHEPHAAMLSLYRDLLGLRRTRPDLRDPRMETVRASVVAGIGDPAAAAVVVTRAHTTVLAHSSERELRVRVPAHAIVWSSAAGARLEADTLVLPAVCAVVLDGGYA